MENSGTHLQKLLVAADVQVCRQICLYLRHVSLYQTYLPTPVQRITPPPNSRSTRRMINQKLCYLVKWDGYRVEHNSWEPWDNLHAPDLVLEFHRKHPGAPRHICLMDFNAITFQSLPLSVVLGRHSLEGGMDVREHLRVPISPTESLCLTTLSTSCLNNAPYVPPHHR